MSEGLSVEALLVKLAGDDADRQMQLKTDLRNIQRAIDFQRTADSTAGDKPGWGDVVLGTTSNPATSVTAGAGGYLGAAYGRSKLNERLNQLYTGDELSSARNLLDSSRSKYSKDLENLMKPRGGGTQIGMAKHDAASWLHPTFRGASGRVSEELVNVVPGFAEAAHSAGIKKPEHIKRLSDIVAKARDSRELKSALRSSLFGGRITDLISKLLKKLPSTNAGKLSLETGDLLKAVRASGDKVNLSSLRQSLLNLGGKSVVKSAPWKAVGRKIPLLGAGLAAVASNIPTLWNPHTAAHTDATQSSNALLNKVRENYLARQESKG